MKAAPMVAMGLFMAISAGCDHSELCLDHSHAATVPVVFDWENAPEASPESMVLYLFPKDGKKSLRYDFSGHRGGNIRIPAGIYDAICMNSDTEGIVYRGNSSSEEFEVTTRTTGELTGFSMSGSTLPPRAGETADERVALAPDILWIASLSGIEVGGISEVPAITFYPELAVSTYTLEINQVENLEHVSEICAVVTSMAGGLLPGKDNGSLSEEKVTIPFSLETTGRKKSLTGKFTAFGHCPDKTRTHLLAVYAMLADGSKWYYEYDVTSIIHRPPVEPFHYHIVLEKLPLPKPIDSGGGFIPDVDEWQSIDVNIEM